MSATSSPSGGSFERGNAVASVRLSSETISPSQGVSGPAVIEQRD